MNLYIIVSFIWVCPKIMVPPKSSILIGFSIINHPFWVSLFLETPIWINRLSPESQKLPAPLQGCATGPAADRRWIPAGHQRQEASNVAFLWYTSPNTSKTWGKIGKPKENEAKWTRPPKQKLKKKSFKRMMGKHGKYLRWMSCFKFSEFSELAPRLVNGRGAAIRSDAHRSQHHLPPLRQSPARAAPGPMEIQWTLNDYLTNIKYLRIFIYQVSIKQLHESINHMFWVLAVRIGA